MAIGSNARLSRLATRKLSPASFSLLHSSCFVWLGGKRSRENKQNSACKLITRPRGNLMSLGTAIFLSTVILSLVILYGLTRDRWRWGRILIGLIVTVLLVVAGMVGLFWYQMQPDRPSKLTALWGIGLGEKESD